MSYVLAIDQGTTSTRAIVFDKNLQIVASSQKEIEQFFPFPGWVEHDLEQIYATVIATARDAVKGAKISSQDILSIGITNQSKLRWPFLKEGNMLVSDQLLIRSCPLAGPSDSVRLKSYCVKSPAQLWI